MKKFLKNLIQGYNYIDLILIALYVIGFVIFAKILEVPFYPAFCGILPLLCVLTISKKTISGYALGILFLTFYAWFLWDFSLLGNFIGVLLLQIPLLVLKLILLAKNKSLNNDTFNKWDYITLFVCLALLSYPLYLLFLQINSNYVLFQTFIFEIMFVIVFLNVKNIKWAKYLNLILSALQLTVFILFIVDLEVATATFAFGSLLALIYQIIYFIKNFFKAKKSKQIETEKIAINTTQNDTSN